MGIELHILNWIQSIRTPWGDVLMPWITQLGSGGRVWILLAVVLFLNKKTRKSGVAIGIAMALNVLFCNILLKNLFGRIRPFDVNTSVRLLIHKPGDYSFPSGHTAVSFAAVSAVYFAGQTRIWKPALLLAVLIAFSRLYLYVHYPTDILGGVFLGILMGFFSCQILRWLQAVHHSRVER